MNYNKNILKNILLQEVGYIEKRKNCPTKNLYEKLGAYIGADNWTKYWKDCADLGIGNYQGSFYCIATLFWAFIQAYGLKAAQELCLQKFMINCQVTHDLFKKKGQVHSTPKFGDIIVFWNGSRFHHAEFVLDVKGDNYKTFGANTSGNSATIVRNGGGCYAPKTYSISAAQKAGHKFLRPAYDSQAVEGWIKVDGNWRYQLSDETYISNAWKYINDRWYMFDGNGNMCTGWVFSNNQWYYCCPEVGCMDIGWQMVNGKWYFMDSDGVMRVGWLQDKDKWYYLCENGEMAIGWKQIANQWYVFGEDGHMFANTWFKSEDDWYFLSSTGAMKKCQWIQYEDGNFYYLMDSGKMAKNSWIKDYYKERYYFVDDNGVYRPEMDAPDAKYPIVE